MSEDQPSASAGSNTDTGSAGRVTPADRQASLALLVVGMHRSGTSALGGVLNLLGVATPGPLHPADEHNPRGYFEGQRFIDFHERVLGRLGSPSIDPLPLGEAWVRSPVATAAAEELAGLLREALNGQPVVLFKDPRLCRLLPLWTRALAEVGCPGVAVLPYRHPLEVAASLQAKAELPRPYALMMWLQHVLAAERASRGLRRSFIAYADLLADWRAVAAKLERDLGLAWPRDMMRAAAEIDAFLSDDLHRQRAQGRPLAEDGLERLCARAVLALEALSKNASDADATAELDRVAADADAALEIVGPLVVDYQRRLERTEREFGLTVENLKDREARLAAALTEQASLQTTLTALEAAQAKAAADSAAEIETLERTHAQLRAEAARRAALARREANAVRARAEQAEAALIQVRFERDTVINSNMWRALAPVRAAAVRMPAPLKRFLLVSAKSVWWTLTLQLPRRLAARRRFLAGQEAVAPSAAAEPGRAQAPTTKPAATARSSSAAMRLVYISGEPDSPGHRYRVARPAAAAAMCGAQVTIVAVDDIPGALRRIGEADVLYIWRAPYGEQIGMAIDAARRGGAKVVFDVDDLMIDPQLANVELIDGIRSQQMVATEVAAHYGRVRHTMALADLCVGATEELARKMRDAAMPAVVLPNGFDAETVARSRRAAREWAAEPDDGLVRIGYASGSRTHQKDFAQCADAVAETLRRHPECRLVLFRAPDGPVLFLNEFEQFDELQDQIEWRPMRPLEELPQEMARFDVNIAPLEVGNPFCEAKSELKYFEAALVDVPTIASPTGPFRRCMSDGRTGFLASTDAEWRKALKTLVSDKALRRRMAADARREVLWTFGPERRLELVDSLLDLLRGGRAAAKAFELRLLKAGAPAAPPVTIPEHEAVFVADNPDKETAEVTVVIPLYNYAHHIEEALDSVKGQKLAALDLVVVDDQSTDNSLEVALAWAKANAGRFSRIQVLQNRVNSGLAFTRNVGFEAADTAYVLTLDADNRLLPGCAGVCLETIRSTGAAFVYPLIRRFGDEDGYLSSAPYDPVRLSNGNYIDAMALVAKAAWSAVGGYDHIRGGWEDFDFWCRLAERGFRGERAPGEALAEYRVHAASMIRSAAAEAGTIRRMMDELERRHSWLTLIWMLPGDRHDADEPSEPSEPAKPKTRRARRALQAP